MTNLLDDLHVAREEADVMVQKLDRVQGRLKPIKAQDGSGEVSVQVDSEGKLRSVRVGFAWRDRLTQTELPAAVLEAFANAKVARFELWSNAYKETGEEPDPRARPTRDGVDMVEAFKDHIDGSDDSTQAAEMVEIVLNDVLAGLEEANRLLEEHTGRRFVGRSGPGHVTAYTSGSGELQEIEFDTNWVHDAHPANLGREATQAIQAAAETAQREGLSAVLQTTRLAQIAHLVTDPDTAHNFFRQD